MVMPLVEVNAAGLLDTKRMSSYFSSAQKLVTSFQHTGARRAQLAVRGIGIARVEVRGMQRETVEVSLHRTTPSQDT